MIRNGSKNRLYFLYIFLIKLPLGISFIILINNKVNGILSYILRIYFLWLFLSHKNFITLRQNFTLLLIKYS